MDSGLWPIVQKLDNDELYVIAFNQPAHGRVPGDIDGWRSTDGGDSWELAGRVAERPNASSNRMNTAFGRANDGLLAISSGYRHVSGKNWQLMEPIVTRSSDNGQTWEEQGPSSVG